MTNKNADAFLGDGGASLPSAQPGKPDDQLHYCGTGSNTIFKSGPLFLSSKGIGWTSWKKRWFILTSTSLVFFRSDPNAVPQKGNEANLTLGGIDLNNSGSVVVKADKKLLTVLFPDGRDGRAFTLKAETTEDLNEWKTALENALAQAPSAANVLGQNGICRNGQTESVDNSMDQSKDREPMKSTVIGRPILLALEDADGTPSFLEKALKFIEEHGVKVEGILRQAADVEDVEHRVREYEQGKVEFSAEEDAHVVADCVKHVLRELPSSPVPASCCKALLEACRTERTSRVSNMRAAICETFPEPNRRLLQRILLMMRAVASHKAENRMSSSAVAACMAPLLLRALLHGDCEIENDFDVGGDGSLQLLQAAAAANHAQAIVITLLEEYDSLFGEGGEIVDMYSNSEEGGTESEEASDVESYDDDDDYEEEEEEEEEEEDESVQESDADEDEDLVSEASSETGNSRANHVSDDKEHNLSSSKSSGASEHVKVNQVLSSNSREISLPQHEDIRNSENLINPSKTARVEQSNKPAEVLEGVFTDQSTVHHSSSSNASCMKKSITMSSPPEHNSQQHTKFGRTAARKNQSTDSIDYSIEDDVGIVTHEAAKTELQSQIAEEVKGNSKLQPDLGNQKKPLHQRRLALELDVASLQEQLQEEKSSRATLEAGPKFYPGPLSDLTSIDEKTKADLEELALLEADLTSLEQKVNDLGIRLNLQHKQNSGSALNFYNKPQQISDQETKLKNKPDTEVKATSQFGRSRSKGANPMAARTKLSFRLNFLKDRRGQIANELQNVDKGQEFGHSAQNPEKGKGLENTSGGPEIHCVSNQEKEKGKGSEFHQTQPSIIKSQGSEIDSVSDPNPIPNPIPNHIPNPNPNPNPEKGRGFGSSLLLPQNSAKMRKMGGHAVQHSETWDQHPQHLDRGKSEGHNPYTVDKGR